MFLFQKNDRKEGMKMQETAAIVVSNCITIFTTISVIWVVMELLERIVYFAKDAFSNVKITEAWLEKLRKR
jgi:hypothetical protein